MEKIKITCYGETRIWDDRKKAIAHFEEAVEACEGAERNRYVNIYLQLIEGYTECKDVENDCFGSKDTVGEEICRALVNKDCTAVIGYYYFNSDAERVILRENGDLVNYAELSVNDRNTVDFMMDDFEEGINRIEDGFEVYKKNGFIIKRKVLRVEYSEEVA
jgi:hypothetical protein